MKRACLLVTLLSACGPEAPGTSPAPTTPPINDTPATIVYATSYPVAFLTERLVGDALEVHCPVPEDADPITWEPTRDELEAFRNAGLVVTNGARFERWIENASLPESRLVRSADDFATEFLRYEERTHSHGTQGEHSHRGIDPHTWLDPRNAARQAQAIARALVAHFPGHTDAFVANLETLESDLERLELAWLTVAQGLGDVNLIASHPAYDYLLRRLGLEATNLDLDPGAALGEEALATVAAARSEGRLNLLLWEGEPLPATRDRLRDELEVRSVLLSPLEVLSAQQRAAGEDYLSLQLAAIERIRAAIAP